MAPFQAPRRASARALRLASHPEEWCPRRAQLLEPELQAQKPHPEWAQQQERAQPLALARHQALVLRRKLEPPDPSQAQVPPALAQVPPALVRVRRLEQVRRLVRVQQRRLVRAG